MKYISYIKIRKFKVFDEEIIVSFDNTTVLIGPNNAGKTTIIQALTLWQLGVRAFFDTKTEMDVKSKQRKRKGKLDTTVGIGINRRDIEQVPNTDTRQLFNKSHIRTGSTNERIQLTVGINHDNEVRECGVEFKYFKSEVLYCYLNELLTNDLNLLEAAATLQINLLYPMSGLEREETVLQEGAIRKQIGRGITAGLLRNICYNLYSNAPEDWKELTKWMEKLFYISIEIPKRLSNDDLVLEYNYTNSAIKTEKSLDILQAGRGQLQMLLILAFVLWRTNSVILIDEPDAHLEVLRQSQVMEVLKALTDKYGNQIIIATHSEVIMNESENLTFLLNGKNIELDETKKKVLKSSLKDFGIEHYYKAELTKSVLYLEGTTDKQNLKEIAEFLSHPLGELLSDKIFVYYTQSPDIQHDEFEMNSGYYTSHKKHFQAISPIVPGLRGIAIFDNDNKNRTDETNPESLTTLFWSQYELENYFITPDSLMKYVEDFFRRTDGGDLFLEPKLTTFKQVLNDVFIFAIFDGNPDLIELYHSSNQKQKNALYHSNSKNKKVSTIVESTLSVFKSYDYDLVLPKNEFFHIIKFCNKDSIDNEVRSKLDAIYATIKSSASV
ncbi:MAG: AAA family ATPase [Saprospiraceae bacterium]